MDPKGAGDPAIVLRETTGTYLRVGAPTFEPTIGVVSTGSIFVNSFFGRGTFVYRSDDKASSWQNVGPFLPGTEFAQVPNSNDPYIYIDPTTDRIIKFDMHGLTCMTLEYSDDLGETWSPPTPACGQPPLVQDHQSIVGAKPRGDVTPIGYPNVLVYCVARALQTIGAFCSSSFDGGVSWTPLLPGYPTETLQCYALHGHLASDADGRIYRGGLGCDGPTVWRSLDDGLTWTEHPVGGSLVALDDNPNGHEVAVAADEGRNVHALWIGKDGLPYLSSSLDHGETWTAPRKASPPDVTAAGFPTIDAGAAGRVALAYVGTTTEGGFDGNSPGMTWNGYIGVVLDALAEDLVVTTVTVNDPVEDPLAYGPCGDRRCGGFGDFIDIAIDPEGRPWAALAHNVDQQEGIVGTLKAGPALRGDLRMLVPLSRE